MDEELRVLLKENAELKRENQKLLETTKELAELLRASCEDCYFDFCDGCLEKACSQEDHPWDLKRCGGCDCKKRFCPRCRENRKISRACGNSTCDRSICLDCTLSKKQPSCANCGSFLCEPRCSTVCEKCNFEFCVSCCLKDTCVKCS